jgi:hypothetical protein
VGHGKQERLRCMEETHHRRLQCTAGPRARQPAAARGGAEKPPAKCPKTKTYVVCVRVSAYQGSAWCRLRCTSAACRRAAPESAWRASSVGVGLGGCRSDVFTHWVTSIGAPSLATRAQKPARVAGQLQSRAALGFHPSGGCSRGGSTAVGPDRTGSWTLGPRRAHMGAASSCGGCGAAVVSVHVLTRSKWRAVVHRAWWLWLRPLSLILARMAGAAARLAASQAGGAGRWAGRACSCRRS